MITAVIGEKGGCGKSTIAVHLAGWRRAAGHEVLLIDSDRQGTSTLWAEARDDRGLLVPDTVQQFGRSIRRTALGFSRRYDDIVIDVAGGDEVAIATSLRIARQAIVPFQPNELDIWTSGYLEDMIEPAMALNDELHVHAVLNRAPTHRTSADTQRAVAALQALEVIHLSDIVIRERSSLRRCVPAGQLIDEWKPPDHKAQTEMSAAYELIFGAVAAVSAQGAA